MNCEFVTSKLSAYLDGELELLEQEKIQQHIGYCEFCRQELRCFERIGEDLRNSEGTVGIDSIWSAIESRLNVALPEKVTWLPSRYVGFAIAASLLFVLGGIAWMNQAEFRNRKGSGHNHSSLAVDFQPVIQFASADPFKAIQGLVKNYRGQQLSPKETENFLGYQPATSNSIPEGFELVSTYVLDMPCCKCSASICQRNDGSSVIVFEHKDEQPLWFGNNAANEEQCAGVQCQIVEAVDGLAVSWKQGQRQFTLIGATDRPEIGNWIRTMKL